MKYFTTNKELIPLCITSGRHQQQRRPGSYHAEFPWTSPWPTQSCSAFVLFPHTEGANEFLWHFSQCKRSQLLAHVILCGRVSQFLVDSQFFTFIIVIIQKLWKWPKNFVDTFNSSTHTQQWQPAPVCHSSPIWPLLDRAITLSLSLSHSMVPWFLPTSRITRI